MNILATVDFVNQSLTQPWKLLEDETHGSEAEVGDFLILMVTESKKCIALPLEKSRIENVGGVKCYLGTLQISEAVIL